VSVRDLQSAVRSHDPQAMEAILLDHPTLLEARCANGWTPLIVAAYEGATQCLRALLRMGPQVDAANPKGTTPPLFAKGHSLRTGDAEPMRELLRAGADAGARDHQGLTLLDYVPADRLAEVEAILNGEMPGHDRRQAAAQSDFRTR
jgi:ankyrin repeat protein